MAKGAYNDDFDHRNTNHLIRIDKHPHQKTSIVSYAMTYVTTALETDLVGPTTRNDTKQPQQMGPEGTKRHQMMTKWHPKCIQNASAGSCPVLWQLVLLACNVYAVLSVTSTQRAINRRCSERDLPLRLWEAHRTLSTTHSGLRRRYMNIWTT